MRHVWRCCLCGMLLFISLYGTASAQEDWMPDPHLRQAVRDRLELPDGTPLTQADMLELGGLNVIDGEVQDLTGLEHARNLGALVLIRHRIEDITPLTSLTDLRFLDLGGNRIADIGPLAGLTDLEVLRLWENRISDISPLSGLVNLRELWLNGNEISDFSPLHDLPNLEILRTEENLRHYIPPVLTEPPTEADPDASRDFTDPTLADRVVNRSYPSTFGAWHNIINLPELSWEERLAYHDLYFGASRLGLQWEETDEGLALVGNLERAREQREQRLARNPNMVFLVGIYYYAAPPAWYPETWPYWLRDEFGNHVQDRGWSAVLIDFVQPGAQDHFVQQAVAVAESGLFDGIFLDWWWEHQSGHRNPRTGQPYYPLEVEVAARVSLVRRIREAVGDDFLILVNTMRSRAPRSAQYINGSFMETLHIGDPHNDFAQIESTLLWAEENFRYPQINSLEGWGFPNQPLDSPANRKRMRLFTTLSLTHSDGYVQYVTGIVFVNHGHSYEIYEGHAEAHANGESHDHTHEHYWYDFWEANLGQPVGEKGQRYENREGLFIREFTNGWAVYNRSGSRQTVQLPEQVTGVESGRRHTTHNLPDLDGEIYLKDTADPLDVDTDETDPHDVNSDGVVNVLDLVAVAQAFGQAAPDIIGDGQNSPDVNGDGVVDVLDILAIANRIDQ